jgi:hypothetical protein
LALTAQDNDMGTIGLMLSLALLMAPSSAAAQPIGQEERPTCADPATPPPAAYAAWATKAPLSSAATPADLPKAEIVAGQAVLAQLHPTREVAYVIQPDKPGGSVAKGGLFQVRVDQPGVYRFAISSGAWLDVLKNGKALESIAHGPGPACSGIRKMVDFPLEPGRYVLQVSANPDPLIAVLVLRQP